MDRFCERCERVTQDGNLWCERTDCPAEQGYSILSYGDHLGDLKVTKLLRVWRTAALYEAVRGDETVLLKVAHRSDDCEERLKRETTVLETLADKPWFPFSLIKSFLPSSRPLLPVPLSPYPVSSKRPYGELTFRGETKFFSIFRHAQGKFLSDLLLENPQLWHYQAAWIVIALAEALRPIASSNRCHLCLTPDMILIDTDKEGYLRPLLLDLGLIVGGNEMESVYDWTKIWEPAYTAPELLLSPRTKTAAPTADVYSLGMILYEMLAGKPAFESKTQRDDQIREVVTQHRSTRPLERPELEHAGVAKIVERAINPNPASRFSNVIELANTLIAVYSKPPTEKRAVPGRLYLLIGTLALISLIVLAMAAYILIRLLLIR
ncbi:MAG: protein kinase [Chloroflexi bacterium]|nr:protein kinase [Chloroflexota bacterium]